MRARRARLRAGAVAVALGLGACGNSLYDASSAAGIAVIGPEGGTLQSPTGFALVVPPRALSGPTKLSIVEATGSLPQGAEHAVEVRPVDTALARPARIVFSGPAGDQLIASVAGAAWKPLPGQASLSAGLAATASHLGVFALLAPRACTPQLRAATTLDDPLNPHAMTTADFDRNGVPDLAIADADSEDLIVALGRGDGSFAVAVRYPVVPGASGVAAADLDGDGAPDLVVAIPNQTFGLLLNRGDGTFGGALGHAEASLEGSYLTRVGVGDFDGDGHPDVALAGGRSAVMWGDGSGGFTGQTFVDEEAGSLAVGDFDGDGVEDLALGTEFQLVVAIAQGSGQFLRSLTRFDAPEALAAADVDRDGILDLAVARAGNSGGPTEVALLLGKGDGSFVDGVVLPTAGGSYALALDDFDQDGHVDLVVGDGASQVELFLGNGDGTFASPLTFSVSVPPRALAVADLDGDGLDDVVVVGEGGGSVLLNTCVAD